MAEISERKVVKSLTDADSVRALADMDGVDIGELLRAVKDEEKKRFLTYKPYPKQLEFHNSKADERVLSGGNQKIPLDAKILTPTGWVRSVDIEVGDEVYTHRGEVTRVEWITDAEDAPLYRLTFNDGTTADCSDDHRWLLVSKRGHEYVRDTKTLYESMRAGGTKYRIPLTEVIGFAEKELAVPPYEMGGKIEDRIPAEYLRASVEQRKELLAGLIDSDGHIDKEGRVSYYSANALLIEDVADLIRGLGGKVRVGRNKAAWYVRGRVPFKPNKIEHKHRWRYENKEDYRTKTIKSIELIGNAVQRCYRVESKTHTFIIDGYNATHNCGKSQPIDEPVLTPNGWIKMGDIEVGDYVIGSDGRPKRVLGVYPQGERDIYEVEFHNGAKVRCDKEHLWTFFHKTFKTMTAREACCRLKKGERLITPMVKSVEFNISKVPIDPYFMGILLGDGSFRNKRITITNVDAEILEYCSEVVKKYDCKLVKVDDITYHVSSNINGRNKLIDVLRNEFDLMGRDSHGKFIPDLYKYNSKYVRIELLRGLIDTDGAISKNGKVEFYSVNEKLCNDVYEVVMSLGIRASVRLKKGRYKGNRHISYRVGIGQTDIALSKLNRKLERQRLEKSNNTGIGVKSIKEAGRTLCQCIYIDSIDHLYVTRDFILTHNTICGCMEMAFHLTGNYPEWWKGHIVEPRVNVTSGEKEISCWVIGTDTKTVRDNLQAKLIGTAAKDFTDGCIHSDLIDRDAMIMARGVTGLVDTCYIRHKSGCLCKLQFRSYEQGRANLQSATVDVCYCDEEPPSDIMGEIRARLGATGGFLYMAFTPLSGMTPLVQEFWNHDNPDKFLVCLSAYEAMHYSPEKLRKLESKYAGLSESERQARLNGIPTMGSGVVYPVDDRELWFDYAGSFPDSWERIGGLDFGRGDHPTAVVWCARDPLTDTVYVYDCMETIRKSVAENASLMRKRGAWIPIAYPHDLMRDSGVSISTDKLKQSEGYRYKQMYEDEGVTLTPTNAKTVEGSTKVEVGICELRQRMLEGRLKVAKHLSEWFKEKQTYRYGEDGKPIKEKDHLLDATRYAIIMLRYAVSEREAMFDYGYNGQTVIDNTKVYDD